MRPLCAGLVLPDGGKRDWALGPGWRGRRAGVCVCVCHARGISYRLLLEIDAASYSSTYLFVYEFSPTTRITTDEDRQTAEAILCIIILY